MSRTEEFRELLDEWHFHRKPHHCYYEEGPDAGMMECPGKQFPTLSDYLAENGFPKADEDVDIVNRQVDRQEGRPLSIAELRAQNQLPFVEGINYSLSNVESDAESDGNAPLENEQHTWVSEAMDYFKERLDAQDEILYAQTHALGVILNQLQRIEDALGEQSEPVQRNIVSEFLEFLDKGRK